MKRDRNLCVVGLCASLFLNLPAAHAAPLDLDAYIDSHSHQIMADFHDLLAMPNLASDTDAIMANAAWIKAYIAQRGFESEIVSAGGAPYIIAEKSVAGATKTVLIYAHFDGQPVAPENWASPPFEPTLRTGMVEDGGKALPWPDATTAFDPEWRLFARSAGDDKAPVIALMAALDALAASGTQPSVNIKLILDGEEEAGSPTLEAILKTYGDRLKTDLLLFCDGPMHQSRGRQLVFGVRGDMGVNLTTYGPLRPLHSGHYGNWAPNPNDRLIQLLAKMKDDEARILVPGYLDDVNPISGAERAAIDALPDMAESLRHDLAIGDTDGGGQRLEDLVMAPAIVIKGYQGGGVGAQGRNIIMPSATASLDLRLVPDQTPTRVRESLNRFFTDQGFTIIDHDPTPDELRSADKILKVDWADGAYGAFRSSLDGIEAKKLIGLLDAIDGKATLLTPTMGGSLPIYLFEQAIDAPIILLPIANHDNNQHGRNENMRLQNLWDAIKVYAAVLEGYGR